MGSKVNSIKYLVFLESCCSCVLFCFSSPPDSFILVSWVDSKVWISSYRHQSPTAVPCGQWPATFKCPCCSAPDSDGLIFSSTGTVLVKLLHIFVQFRYSETCRTLGPEDESWTNSLRLGQLAVLNQIKMIGLREKNQTWRANGWCNDANIWTVWRHNRMQQTLNDEKIKS